jgi:uncharacterized protein (TIGR03067 family)
VTRSAALVLLAALTALGGGCKKKPDDNTLAQGEWRVLGVDTGDEADGPRRDELESVSVVVQGDRVTINHAKEKGGLSATFVLDPTKSPREIDVTDVTITGADREQKMPGTTRGIYKFNDEELVVALPIGMGKDLPRPTAFKPLPDKREGGVLVLYLKRK